MFENGRTKLMLFVGGQVALLCMSVVVVKFPWRPGSREFWVLETLFEV